jgi:class 3 adenylate cyclase/pimeloyl-ACP methyl ester carboxylesterase
MAGQVRYCTTDDGVRIAYSVQGQGPPLVVCPFFYESFADDDAMPQMKDLMDSLGAGRQVIRYCVRGSALSQRDGADLSQSKFPKDIEAVARAAGLERFALMGFTASGGTAIEFAALHPDQVSHLILYGTWARLLDVMPRESLSALAALCRTNWPMASQTLIDMSARREAPEFAMELAKQMRQNISGERLAALIEDFADFTHLLPAVKAPTLVLHRTGDSAVPFTAAQNIAAGIPNARLVPLKGEINYPGMGDSQAIADAVITFLDEGRKARAEPADKAAPAGDTVRTILFTDLVGHTAMMRRLGDAAGREVLRDHERITRDVLKAHAGAEVKTMGDGFMVSFGSITKAVECAIALQRAFGARNESAAEPLRVRVGLNAGQPIEEEGDLFGETVILAARIAAQAEGGEILASLAVRELCAGKGFLFADRGGLALRGFEDPVRAYEVRWRE